MPRRLDQLVVDSLIVEGLLDLPAGVDVVVDEGEKAAVKADLGHAPTLFGT